MLNLFTVVAAAVNCGIGHRTPMAMARAIVRDRQAAASVRLCLLLRHGHQHLVQNHAQLLLVRLFVQKMQHVHFHHPFAGEYLWNAQLSLQPLRFLPDMD